MYVILTIFIFGFSVVKSERLECYDCSEIATDSAAVCSKNETRSKKAVDDEGNIFEFDFCRMYVQCGRTRLRDILSQKNFAKSTLLVISLVKPLLSRNFFLQKKCVIGSSLNYDFSIFRQHDLITMGLQLMLEFIFT